MSSSLLLYKKFFFSFLLLSIVQVQAQVSLADFEGDDFNIMFNGKLKEETFYSCNAQLLNDENDMDRVWYAQHALDLEMHALYGTQKYGHEAIEFLFNMRDKAHWGNPTTIASTTETTTKITDFVTKGHRHFVAKHFFWIRELWLKCSINALVGINSDSKCFVTIGAFPFQLGRGIALGDAFSVNPGLLGFYSEDAVDQYAFGAKLFGDLITDSLTYDVYAAIIENNSDSFRKTAEKIRLQYLADCDFKSGKIYPFRGFGSIDYIVAGRLQWKVIDSEKFGRAIVEPYIMYNRDPEQKVEFPADANSKLGTVGFATSWYGARFEGGFDTAINFGRQQVVSLDRNLIELKREGATGDLQLRYSHVLTENPNTVSSPSKATITNDNKSVVDNGRRNVTDNGQQIGTSGLYNALDRFRAGYENKYRGWMFVADVAYWFDPNVLKAALTVGVATGDENPNRNLDDEKDAEVDGDFKGFLGIQEVYVGQQVISAFVLGARKPPRPLSVPSSLADDEFASSVSGFTNLAFCGGAVHWTPKDSKHQLRLNPNVLAFWQEHKTRAFDQTTNKTSDNFARRYLGLEVNCFASMNLLKNLKCYCVIAGFFSGSHYDDIKGKPLDKDQREFIDRKDATGFTNEPEPLLGNSNAFMMNMGVEYRF